MMKYVLGFAFTDDHEQVVLIRKHKGPEGAQGLNGLGGKVEVGAETDCEAMQREWVEEAGPSAPDVDWLLLCMLQYPEECDVVVYRGTIPREDPWLKDLPKRSHHIMHDGQVGLLAVNLVGQRYGPKDEASTYAEHVDWLVRAALAVPDPGAGLFCMDVRRAMELERAGELQGIGALVVH